jgi:predicted transcriptional regulator
MIELLKRPEGATVEQIAEEMGWARHSVRGAMAGALRKKLGLTIISEKSEGRRVYRIVE